MMKIVMLCLVFIACNKTNFDAYSEVEIKSPLRFDEQLSLRVSPKEDGDYALWMIIGHGDDYKYENLYLKYHLVSEGDTLLQDVKYFALTDGGGRWNGKDASQGFQIEDSLASLSLLTSNSYKLIVEQYSRDNPIEGLNLVGVGLKPI